MAPYRTIRDAIKFGYAVGRVRVLETRLLKHSHYERLLDARNFDDQRRVLSETVYGAYLDRAQSAEDVEIALDRVLADLYDDFLETANLPDEMVAFFRTMHDFENLRGRLKAQALGIPATELLNSLGSVPAEKIAAGELPPPLAASEARIRARAGEEISVDGIDALVDVELYRALSEVASSAENPHIRQMATVGADLANVKAFVRLRSMGAAAGELDRHVVPGGTITGSELASLFRLPLAEAIARLVQRPTLKGADVEALVDRNRFDVAADALVVRHLRGARRVAIGPEPVIAYVMQRKLEASMLRTLLIGKIAGVSRDVLRVRMRDVA